MSNYEERHRKMLEDILEEEQIESMRKMCVDEEELMHLYNTEFDRDKQEFKNAVEEVLESEKIKEVHRTTKDKIQNLIRTIEKYQGIEKGIVTDQLKKQQGENRA